MSIALQNLYLEVNQQLSLWGYRLFAKLNVVAPPPSSF
jgi:hypothetical protein